MKAIAINGSPRKSWNTAKLLEKALEGAASQGAKTTLISLYDLRYTGCTSCFACKRIGGPSYGKCAVKDELQPVLREIETCDVLLLGSPIYFGEVTGEMRSFLERLFFQYLVYDKERTVLSINKPASCFFYTMNVPNDILYRVGYEEKFKQYANLLSRMFGPSESQIVPDTYQFHDYAKYMATAFDAESKKIRHETEFPKELQKAYAIGARLASGV